MSDLELERGRAWLDTLLQLAGLSVRVEAAVVESSEDMPLGAGYWLTLNPQDLDDERAAMLVGDRGSVLDAIQSLANSTLNVGRSPDERTAYLLELNGYRRARLQEVQQQAEAAAARVRESGEAVELAGLSAAERRQVHTRLKAQPDLDTVSHGQDPDRRLVVQLR